MFKIFLYSYLFKSYLFCIILFVIRFFYGTCIVFLEFTQGYLKEIHDRVKLKQFVTSGMLFKPFVIYEVLVIYNDLYTFEMLVNKFNGSKKKL